MPNIYPVTFKNNGIAPFVVVVEVIADAIKTMLNGSKALVITDLSLNAINIGTFISKEVSDKEIISVSIADECQQELIEKLKSDYEQTGPIVLVSSDEFIDVLKQHTLNAIYQVKGDLTFGILKALPVQNT